MTDTDTKKADTTADTGRTVVVAVDGSEHSDYALDWYCKHVHREGDHVVMVYVPELNNVLHSSKWGTSVYMFDREVMEAMLQQEQARIRVDLEKFADKLKHHGLGGKVKSIMASKPAEGILRAVEEVEADLLIVGSRGQGTLRRTFMGSVSDYLVHHSHIPVIVCKHPKFLHHPHHQTPHQHHETEQKQI